MINMVNCIKLTLVGEDAIDKFLNDVIKEIEYYSKITETEFNKPLVMSEKDHEDFNNSNKDFNNSKKAYEEGEPKVKDYNLHIKNLNLSLTKKITAVFHNLQKYDSHLIFQEIGK